MVALIIIMVWCNTHANWLNMFIGTYGHQSFLFHQMVQWITVIYQNLCALSRGNKELWSGRRARMETENSIQTDTSGKIWDTTCRRCLQGHISLLSKPWKKQFNTNGTQHAHLGYQDLWNLWEPSIMKHALITTSTMWLSRLHRRHSSPDYSQHSECDTS